MDDAPKCQVQASLIHGSGLFSLIPFQSGQTIVDYSQIKFAQKPFVALTQSEIDRCWWLGVTQEICEVPTEYLKFFYANHSNSPNCHWDREKRQLIAAKDIDKNSEITYNYTLDVKPTHWGEPQWLINQI